MAWKFHHRVRVYAIIPDGEGGTSQEELIHVNETYDTPINFSVGQSLLNGFLLSFQGLGLNFIHGEMFSKPMGEDEPGTENPLPPNMRYEKRLIQQTTLDQIQRRAVRDANKAPEPEEPPTDDGIEDVIPQIAF